MSNIYHALALLDGLTTDTDLKHWKDNNPEQYQQLKALLLRFTYGVRETELATMQRKYPNFMAWAHGRHH